MKAFAEYLPGIEAAILKAPGADHPLAAPMAYALEGGKRLRPGLLLLSAEACGGRWEQFLPAAAAVECIHAYSLVHDDLPAMDDDDLRRGRPTVHKAFGEATAILVGDGLLTLAFTLLARSMPEVAAERALRAIAEIAAGAGVGPGMVGGQALDLDGAKDAEGSVRVARAKTGALLGAAAAAGAELAGAKAPAVEALRTYGRSLGVAFQIRDDLLDVVGSEAELGKRLHKDADKERPNIVRFLGVEGARSVYEGHAQIARAALSRAASAGVDTQRLITLLEELAERTH
ncbi:MAG: polyprenyl synthetase family protein [Thermaerobacter sp.]|nr:polyprenyl synthetase family protein [Thermaerobacter sp.]